MKTMMEIAVYDTKPYDREYLARAAGSDRVAWRFHEFRLCADTAAAAEGAGQHHGLPHSRYRARLPKKPQSHLTH